MQKPTVKSVTDSLPAHAICERLGVKERSIRLARERGVFPASWYRAIGTLCVEYGVSWSADLFNWKAPDDDVSQRREGQFAPVQEGASK